MKQRIYIDTSVVGGYFDQEFKEATRALFERLENNEIVFVVSDLLDLELTKAPKKSDPCCKNIQLTNLNELN